jgi:hypothetical protein
MPWPERQRTRQGAWMRTAALSMPRPGLSLVSDVTSMITSGDWLIQRHSNEINESIHFLKQSWRGRVVGVLGGAGVCSDVTLLQ